MLAKSLKTVFNKDHFVVNLVYQISIKNRKMTWNINQIIYILDNLQFMQLLFLYSFVNKISIIISSMLVQKQAPGGVL